MTFVSGGRSTLNPDAPPFIPDAIQKVEDFSPEWWELIKSSPWFHHYWIGMHLGEDGFYDNGEKDIDLTDLLMEAFDFDAMDDSDFDAISEI